MGKMVGVGKLVAAVASGERAASSNAIIRFQTRLGPWARPLPSHDIRQAGQRGARWRCSLYAM